MAVLDQILKLIKVVLPVSFVVVDLATLLDWVVVDKLELTDLGRVVLLEQFDKLLLSQCIAQHLYSFSLFRLPLDIIIRHCFGNFLALVRRLKLLKDWQASEHKHVCLLGLSCVDGLVVVSLLQKDVVVNGQVCHQLVEVLK